MEDVEGKERFLIFDSMEITGEWDLRSEKFERLARLKAIRIAVPPVVIEEVVGNHSRQVQEVLKTVPGTNSGLRRLGLPEIAVGTTAQPYRSRLMTNLGRFDALILPWPDADHSMVSKRAIDRVSPFDQKGGGYRDTLIWLSVLELASRGHDVILATRDGAFLEKGVMKRSLRTEVEKLRGTVDVVQDLSRWVGEQELVSSSIRMSDEDLEVCLDEFYTMFLGPWSFEDVWLEPFECGFGIQAGISQVESFAGPRSAIPIYARYRASGGAYVELRIVQSFHLASRPSVYNPNGAEDDNWAHEIKPGQAEVVTVVELAVTFKISFEEKVFRDSVVYIDEGASGENEDDRFLVEAIEVTPS